jgi:hypothetical protein
LKILWLMYQFVSLKWCSCSLFFHSTIFELFDHLFEY